MRAPLDFLIAPDRREPAEPSRRASGVQDVAAPVAADLVAAASDLRRRGDHRGAARELARAEALAPGDRSIAFDLAACLTMSGEPAQACDRFLKVLDGEPDHVEARYGLGVALSILGRRAAARLEFERTVELDPSHAPTLGALAFALHEAGETARARELAERAVALAPGRTEARVVLAKLAAADLDHPALEAHARALLARPETGPDNHALAWLLLGDALDGRGDYARAFAAYAAGKAEQRRLYAPRFGREAGSARDVAERALARFAAHPLPHRPRPAPGPGPGSEAPRRHAFLLGFPRSGTTLLEQVLDAHPDVVSLEEAPTLGDTQQVFMEAEDGFARLAGLSDARWTARRRAYWARVRGLGVEPAGKVFVDKLPLATLGLPAISVLFPEAKILFAIRDPRDVVLSCLRRSFQMNRAMYEFTDLERAARFYDVTMRTAVLARERCALDVHEVRYERLVADFEGETRALCAALGVEWSAEMRGFSERARVREIKTPSAPQVARGLYTGAAGHWRRYRDALQPVLPLLQPWVERFGYPPQ